MTLEIANFLYSFSDLGERDVLPLQKEVERVLNTGHIETLYL
jgi:hypothetical protein